MELKPCPFCGGESHAVWHTRNNMWGAHCSVCPVELYYVAPSQEEAIAAWNTRADAAEIAKLRTHVESADYMREIAQGLGYPSILEALEDIAKLREDLAEAVGALEGVQPYLNTMLVDGDPDDECVGWEGDGTPINFTMGQIRRVNTALTKINSLTE